ncbi:MAG TPA: superoxide dismutase family protein [Bryobacteraceae bacterium]|nr:superoxide dismutase family protein [Bryobacteraceae bacterium]
MQTKIIGVSTTALLLVACAPNSASTEGQRARVADGAKVELKDKEGKKVGTLTVSAHSSGGVQINGPLTDLPPGVHGLHIHEKGECDGPSFESAGAHFNPTVKQHGELNPEGPHAGDLGNVRIDTNGMAQLSLLAERVTLNDSPNSLLKPGGTSILVHAGPDDLKTDPSGGSGERIACGVVTR